MTTAAPIFSSADITAEVARITCCSGNLAFTLIDNQWKGIKNCECSWQELLYLAGVKEFLSTYSPPNTIVNAGQPAMVSFRLPNNSHQITTIRITVNGLNVYTSNVGQTGTAALITSIISGKLTHSFEATTDSAYNINIYTPVDTSYYNGQTVIISYFDVTSGVTVTYTATMSNGQYLSTAAMQCLTTPQVQNLFEGSTHICGCEGCTTNTDTTPQPGAVIIYQNVGVISIVISAGDFVGGTYQNNNLIGKTPGGSNPGFNVWSDPGGTLLNYPSDYTFNAGTGTIIMPAGGYLILIY